MAEDNGAPQRFTSELASLNEGTILSSLSDVYERTGYEERDGSREG